MPKRRFDAIIIGTGQAGPYLAASHRAGQKVAIVERKLFGGTCVNTGCIPTKTMVASAYAAHMAAAPPSIGVDIDGAVRVDMKRVKARKDAISGQSRDGRRDVAAEHGELHRLPGPRPLRIRARGQRRRRAAHAPTDLHQRRRPRGRARHARASTRSPFLTNSSMMDVDFLPEHLIVVGGSYIGLEFGQMFRRFGSEVTIVEMGPRLDRREDEDVSAAIREILEREGIDVRAEREVHRLRQAGRRDRRRRRLRRRRAARCRHARAARRRPPSQYRRSGPRQGRRRDRRARLHRGRRPAAHERPGHLGAGRLQRQGRVHPHRPTTTPRSSSPTCSTTIRAGSAIASPPTRSTSIRRSVAPGMTEAEVRKTGRQALVGKRPMTRVAPRRRKGRDARLHEDRGRRRDARDPGRRDPRLGRRRGRSTRFST